MDTTLTIKTNKNLMREAKSVSGELGVPLTTVVNAMLKQFIRERKLVLSADYIPKPNKIAEWEKESALMDKNPKKYRRFYDAASLIKYLEI